MSGRIVSKSKMKRDGQRQTVDVRGIAVSYMTCGQQMSNTEVCQLEWGGIQKLEKHRARMHTALECRRKEGGECQDEAIFPDYCAEESHYRIVHQTSGHCSFCPSAMKNRTTLEKHWRKCPDPSGPWQCPECPNEVPNEDALWLHLIETHGTAPRDIARILYEVLSARPPPNPRPAKVSRPASTVTQAVPTARIPIFPGTWPTGFVTVSHPGLEIVFNTNTKQPAIVFHTHTPASSLTNTSVAASQVFKPDPKLLPTVQHHPDAYKGVANVHKGHLAPLALFRTSEEARDVTMMMSNAASQWDDFNTGIWTRAENEAQRIVETFPTSDIASGTHFLPPFKFVEGLHIANYFWKTVAGFKEDGSLGEQKSWFIPHERGLTGHLADWEVTLEELETSTGWYFATRHK